MKQSIKPRPQIDLLADGILQGNRMMLSQAITIIESNLAEDQKLSSGLLDKIIHATGNSIRIGITGVPGVGKSSFIEAFGKYIINLGKRVAVLAVDPSSQLSKGSILGDKTRMEELSKNSAAYVRPSPAGNKLGGVAHSTYETILLCEAAGFDIIIVETVGVGQSEVSVKNVTDFFLLLMLAGAGDELQGMKKGITEIADALVITKADHDNVKHATAAKAAYQQALHLQPLARSGWIPGVLTASAHTGEGIGEIWKLILSFTEQTMSTGFFHDNRRQQGMEYFEDRFKSILYSEVENSPALQAEKEKLKHEIQQQKISPTRAAEMLLIAFHREAGMRKF
ncbi:MAG TPA: methylmalonyl Co-A mutase-associated GTPase MeaB [Chryseolinea sp.]